jgi:hypothetical protein
VKPHTLKANEAIVRLSTGTLSVTAIDGGNVRDLDMEPFSLYMHERDDR